MDENKTSQDSPTVNSELHSSWVAHSDQDISHELPGPITNPEELLPSGDNASVSSVSENPSPVITHSQEFHSEPTRNYKTFVLLGISLTLLACTIIAAIAYMTIFSKNKYASNQIVNVNTLPTVMPTQAGTNVFPSDILKDVVMTSEDPTRPGVPVEKKTAFQRSDERIYATVVLNSPSLGTKVSYIRYLNSNYMDHGTIVIDQQNTKYVHFEYELVNQKVMHPAGTYQLKIYINDTWVKTLERSK
jgi:hypothetical protein